MLSSAGRVGLLGGPEGNVSCGENLIFYSVCCSIQSGNASSLGRLSKEYQIITYQLDYVIVRIGFLFGSNSHPLWFWRLTSMKHSGQQEPDGISASECFCLDQWLMAFPNYSPSLSLSGSFFSWLLTKVVFALQSAASIFTFSFKLKKEETAEENSNEAWTQTLNSN